MRFRREAQAAGRLNHPNIVSIHDFGEDSGAWYIAMEYVSGRELKDYFDSGERFTTADIVRIMSQILAALGFSHRQGVIHRDIKPANIFLLGDRSVKVADFGIAHIESSNLTQVGTVLGTPSYMSPEQIMGLPVDGRSDLFSAGVIFYQFLTGERPFAGSATSTMQRVLREDPLPPSLLNVQIPAAMDAVMRKALAKRPDERFQNAEEFSAAIRDAAQHVSTAPVEAPMVAMAAASSDATLVDVAKPLPVQREATVAAGAMPPAAAKWPPPAPEAAGGKMAASTLAVAAIVVAVGLGATGWYAVQRQRAADSGTAPATIMAATSKAATGSKAAASAPSAVRAADPASAGGGAASSATNAGPVASAGAARKTEPGMMLVSAVGLIDPSDPRYGTDKSLLQSDLRADSKGQLVAKALALFIDDKSLARHYDLLQSRLMANSGRFIDTVVKESEPSVDKDGLMSLATEGVVNVKALQKSLNEMSRAERIELIRASGDPRISVRIAARDADIADGPAQTSAIAENLLKERIKSFGFRIWAEQGGRGEGAPKAADFSVEGEVRIRKLSTRLPASGMTVSKYALTSWTIKCVDLESGEEIYYNTTVPTGMGSWASEEEALKAIGSRIADSFSRDFFLQHARVTGQQALLSLEGMPDAASEALVGRDLMGLPGIITVRPADGGTRVYDIRLAGSGTIGDLIADGVARPLNAKLGQACFRLGAVAAQNIAIVFDQACRDAPVLSRLEKNPPAALYSAPPGRRKEVVKNPEMLRKLSV